MSDYKTARKDLKNAAEAFDFALACGTEQQPWQGRVSHPCLALL